MRDGFNISDPWLRPSTLDDASRLAATDGAMLVAGGCEITGLRSQRAGQFRSLVDLRNVAEFEPLYAHPKRGLRIGALTTIRQTSNHLWVAKRWAALHEATEQFSSPQVRNTATVAGNICAGDSRYDMATALLALRGSVHVYRNSRTSTVGIGEFYREPGQPDLIPGDVVTSISAPPPAPDAGSAFRKIMLLQRRPNDIQQRRANGIRKFSAAAYIALDPAGKTIVDAIVVIGGSARGPSRAVTAEASLLGMPANTKTFEDAGEIAADSLSASGDVDFLENYPRRLTRALVRDVIEQAVSRARSKHDPFEDASDLLRENSV